MAVKEYSVRKLGKNYKVSEHFALGEFQCSDGSDIVKIDSNLLAFLEKLRAFGGFTIDVVSGYRTSSYNRKIGGASKSTHTQGYAADIKVKKDGKFVSGKLICCIAKDLGFNGVALIKGTGYSVHVDTANRIYRGDENYGYGNNVPNGNFYKYFNISKSQVEALKVKTNPVVKEDDEDMTEEKFEEMYDALMAKKEKEAPASWSQAARTWAEKNGIIKGTGSSMAYKKGLTREEMVEFLYRFGKLFKLIK